MNRSTTQARAGYPRRIRARRRLVCGTFAVILGGLVLTACSEPTESEAEGDGSGTSVAQEAVTVENCGEDVEFQAPVQKMFVNDSNILSIAIAAGAADHVSAATVREGHRQLLSNVYGDEADDINYVAERADLETVVAEDPEMMFAGWNYGFKDETPLNPSGLAEHDIDSYLLSETCRSGQGTRGTMDPWVALRTDLFNIGEIAGDADRAQSVVDDIDSRLETLSGVPQPDETPTAFLVDSANDTIFTSGSFGGPQGILEAAGARNATEDVADTWTDVSWEKIATEDPDVLVFVDYEAQSYEEKLEALRTHPATRDLEAVKEERFINIPYVMWCSGPLNIDAAEIVRKGMESYGLAPESDIDPEISVSDMGVDGNEWATEG
ncbi:ABC transporter substrate-binding protein [Dietzia timorensis]|uniref:Fe/B12 periplasmic-binding domain-containing protein n=1 Tax=Dietzia timorensis TaxID=499555 RepID=A0A173LF51_9ACTN|nr:ABC transporter substrate-binding protein [Dietzia timorensis]ANI90845.1 Hypothetical protein BJL86_0033 [Dietzia timorensis]